MPFALVRARTPGGLDPAGETEAIVDIGADVVSVVVHTGGVPRYVRMIPGIGWLDLTRALVEQTGRSWAEAEELSGLSPPCLVGPAMAGRTRSLILEVLGAPPRAGRRVSRILLEGAPAASPS